MTGENVKAWPACPESGGMVTCITLIAGRLWCGLDDGAVRVFNEHTGALAFELQIHEHAIGMVGTAFGAVWITSVEDNVAVVLPDGANSKVQRRFELPTPPREKARVLLKTPREGGLFEVQETRSLWLCINGSVCILPAEWNGAPVGSGPEAQAAYVTASPRDPDAFCSCLCGVATGSEIWIGQSCGVGGFMREDSDGALLMYNANTRSLVGTLRAGVQAGVVTVINTGPLVWCGLEDGCVCLVDTASRSPRFKWRAHKSPILFLKGARCGPTVITGSAAGNLRVWDAAEANMSCADAGGHAMESMCEIVQRQAPLRPSEPTESTAAFLSPRSRAEFDGLFDDGSYTLPESGGAGESGSGIFKDVLYELDQIALVVEERIEEVLDPATREIRGEQMEEVAQDQKLLSESKGAIGQLDADLKQLRANSQAQTNILESQRQRLEAVMNRREIALMAAEMKERLQENKVLRSRWGGVQKEASELAAEIRKTVTEFNAPVATPEDKQREQRLRKLQADQRDLSERWRSKVGDPARMDALRKLDQLPATLAERTQAAQIRLEKLSGLSELPAPESLGEYQVNAGRVGALEQKLEEHAAVLASACEKLDGFGAMARGDRRAQEDKEQATKVGEMLAELEAHRSSWASELGQSRTKCTEESCGLRMTRNEVLSDLDMMLRDLKHLDESVQTKLGLQRAVEERGTQELSRRVRSGVEALARDSSAAQEEMVVDEIRETKQHVLGLNERLCAEMEAQKRGMDEFCQGEKEWSADLERRLKPIEKLDQQARPLLVMEQQFQHEEEQKIKAEALRKARREAEIMQQQQHLTRVCTLCEAKYTNATNDKRACRYHPGEYQGFLQGKFFEKDRMWDCCAAFSEKSPGCRVGEHTDIPLKFLDL
eukprot:TRINITY_DN4398_c0_g1_i1.p1 TRINITY_DN4398_c0_g1~~TRINITY_DN4398_c0_g1_i1.p1  ORF type:complete len:890 (+),score=244.57 TRINITY_DN4398_c0_g1_i1:288-2957(+)